MNPGCAKSLPGKPVGAQIMYCILGRQALEWEIYGMDANLRENTTIYIKVLRIGYADAGRGNLPRLLCPLQNAGSPNLDKPE